MYRSKLIAAMVNKETQVSMHPTVLSKAYTSLHFGDKEGNKHRLNDYTDSKICVRTRLPSKNFDGKCKDVCLRTADKSNVLSTVVRRDRRTFKKAFAI